MAGGKRPSNYARNSTRNHTKHNQSNYFSLWSAPFLQFVPQPSNQLPPLSRHSTEEWLSQESTRSSSLGQGNAASCSSGEDNEISYTIGKTLEQYIEQVADRIGQRETSNYEIQLQRLQEKVCVHVKSLGFLSYLASCDTWKMKLEHRKNGEIKWEKPCKT